MCIEDIRIGRRSGYSSKTIPATGAVQQLCGPNSKRTSLRIFSSVPPPTFGSASVSSVGPQQNVPGAASGIVLNAAFPSVSLCIGTDGLAVCDSWYGYDIAGASDWWVVQETFLEDDALRQAIDPNLQGQS